MISAKDGKKLKAAMVEAVNDMLDSNPMIRPMIAMKAPDFDFTILGVIMDELVQRAIEKVN